MINYVLRYLLELTINNCCNCCSSLASIPAVPSVYIRQDGFYVSLQLHHQHWLLAKWLLISPLLYDLSYQPSNLSSVLHPTPVSWWMRNCSLMSLPLKHMTVSSLNGNSSKKLTNLYHNLFPLFLLLICGTSSSVNSIYLQRKQSHNHLLTLCKSCVYLMAGSWLWRQIWQRSTIWQTGFSNTVSGN